MKTLHDEKGTLTKYNTVNRLSSDFMVLRKQNFEDYGRRFFWVRITFISGVVMILLWVLQCYKLITWNIKEAE